MHGPLFVCVSVPKNMQVSFVLLYTITTYNPWKYKVKQTADVDVEKTSFQHKTHLVFLQHSTSLAVYYILQSVPLATKVPHSCQDHSGFPLSDVSRGDSAEDSPVRWSSQESLPSRSMTFGKGESLPISLTPQLLTQRTSVSTCGMGSCSWRCFAFDVSYLRWCTSVC